MFYCNALETFFKALIQRTDCCTEVMWLLVQTHHIIRCSHKRYKNRYFNQHMIFPYCEEGSRYFHTVKRAHASLCKRADSHEPLLPAQEILIFVTLSSDFACANVQTHQSIRCWRVKHTNRHLRQHKRFCTVTQAKVSMCKCADSPDPSLLAQNGIQLAFESPHENFEL